MGGVKKSIVAKITYNQFSHGFEHCCFVSNNRDTSELKGIRYLQNQLISCVNKWKLTEISNVDEGIKTIKGRLSSKRVLFLFDDVDQKKQLNALGEISMIFRNY